MEQILVLSIHIAAGALGLVIGPFVMVRDTKHLAAGHRSMYWGGVAYEWSVLAVCLTSVGLVILKRTDLWWLIPVAAVSYALAVLGRRAAARAFRSWSHAYVHGQGGSYIALFTAFIVVALTVDGPVRGPAELIVWLLPVAVGTPLLEVWRKRIGVLVPH